MISVIKIVGDSFDFRTGKETPKSIVLSNGKKEVSIYVNDEEALAIVSMLADEVVVPEVKVHVEPVTPVSRPALVAMTNETVDMRTPAEPELVDEPNVEDPGVDYADKLTGVGSL